MRIVVDEMPKKAEECLCIRYDDFDYQYCGLCGGGCYLANGAWECGYLVPIEEAYDEAMDERRRSDSLGYW